MGTLSRCVARSFDKSFAEQLAHELAAFLPELLEFNKREYEEKLRIRSEQAEERRLRLEEKKAMLERMENPPASPRSDKRKKKKRGRKEKRQLAAQGKQSEFETMMESILPSKADLLPYLPTPSEIVIRKEGKSHGHLR